MMNFIDDFLGSQDWCTQRNGRWYCHNDPGFISSHPEAVERTVLVASAIIEILNTFITNRQKIVPGWKRLTNNFRRVFNRKPGEDPVQAKKRILWNYKKIGLLSACLATAITGCSIIVKKDYLNHSKQWLEDLEKLSIIKTIGNFGVKLTIAPVIYTGYSLIGVTHAGLSAYQYKYSKIRFVKHICSAAIAFAAIAVMASGRSETRWHHMSYAELMLIPSLNALNFLGAELVFDSMLYWIKPDKDNMDFSNIFTTYFTVFLIQIIALSVFQKAAEQYFDFDIDNQSTINQEIELEPLNSHNLENLPPEKVI